MKVSWKNIWKKKSQFYYENVEELKQLYDFKKLK